MRKTKALFDRAWKYATHLLGAHTVYNESCWDYRNRYMIVTGQVKVFKVRTRARALGALEKGATVYDLHTNEKITFDTGSH